MRSAIVPALAVALGLVACSTDRASDEQAREVRLQGAPPAASSPPVTYERPLAHRREMQGFVDSARVLLAHGDTGNVPALLHRSAAFLLVHASAPSSDGTPDMVAVSLALDSLAGDLPANPRTALRTLDALSARANLAEAERHAMLASTAWARLTRQPVADELIMTSDHIQRAARDAGMPLSRELRSRLDELHAIVEGLPKRRELEHDALDEVLAGLHGDLVVMRARLARQGR